MSTPTLDTTIILNGEEVRVPHDATLTEMLEHLGRDPEQKGIAVAVNDDVIRRALWPRTQLRDGDRVEIITAFQGG